LYVRISNMLHCVVTLTSNCTALMGVCRCLYPGGYS